MDNDAELIPAMDINEILLHFASPENLQVEVSSDDLETAKKVLAEKFDVNYKAAQSLRETIANYKGNIEHFKSIQINPRVLRGKHAEIDKEQTHTRIKTQLGHLAALLTIRSRSMVNQQKKDYREYWDIGDKDHTPEVPYVKLDDETRKRVELALLTDAYHQYFDKGMQSKKGKWIPDFLKVYNEEKRSRNEFLVHKKRTSSKAYFLAFFIRQKEMERVIRKIYKNIMIEERLAKLEGRPFDPMKSYISDYIGLRVIGQYFQRKPDVLETLFFPPGPSIGYWQYDGEEHARSRIGCQKYYLENHKQFSFSKVAVQFTDLTSVIVDEFSKDIGDLVKNNPEQREDGPKPHARFKVEWYKITDGAKLIQLNKAGADIQDLQRKIESCAKYYKEIERRFNIILPTQ